MDGRSHVLHDQNQESAILSKQSESTKMGEFQFCCVHSKLPPNDTELPSENLMIIQNETRDATTKKNRLLSKAFAAAGNTAQNGQRQQI